VEGNPAAVNAPVLETLSLTRRFGEHTAVDSLTVSVKRGEVFGLLGPNGAGKTTMLKMLTTLLPPTSGTARIAGFDIVRQSADVRRVIGYVPQLLSAEGALLCNRVAIMHLGKVAVIGTPAELKASLNGNGKTLEDVFIHYAGDTLESGGDYGEFRRTRLTARRLG
jgi:ABC-type multidrug transport system ATPase subunit